MIWANPCFYIAIAALLIKLYIGAVIQCNWRPGISLFALFLICSTLQTISEVIHFIAFSYKLSALALISMDAYYLTMLATIVALPFSVSAVISRPLSNYLGGVAILVFLTVGLGILVTDYFIQGYKPIMYSYTRIAGDYYWTLQALTFAVYSYNFYMLLSTYKKTDQELIRVKCANMLFGFIWLFLTLLAVVILMNLGFEINAGGILPLAMSVYLIFMFIDIKDDRVYDIRTKLPWTKQYKLIQEIIEPYQYKSDKPIDSRELTKKYNHGLVDIAKSMFETPGKQAKWLGVSRTTVVRRKSEKNKE